MANQHKSVKHALLFCHLKDVLISFKHLWGMRQDACLHVGNGETRLQALGTGTMKGAEVEDIPATGPTTYHTENAGGINFESKRGRTQSMFLAWSPHQCEGGGHRIEIACWWSVLPLASLQLPCSLESTQHTMAKEACET